MTTSSPLLCTFESRRSVEMQSLIERMGGTAFAAPSMQEVPVEKNVVAIEAIRRLLAGDVASMVLMTGVGTDSMLNVADSYDLRESLLAKMSELPLLIRGPKPAAVLSRLGLKWKVKAAEPNTWRELMVAIQESDVTLNGTTVAVQEYGVANQEFYTALENQGARVLPVPVYRWALPDDVGPLKDAIHQTVDGQFDALLFTSAQQVRHVLQVADQEGIRESWLAAASECLVASIGPTCSETLIDEGLAPGFEASPPKMGPLVRGTLQKLQASSTDGR